jgi:hypothetical protein
MITIVFPDRATEKRAVGFLLGRFSGRILKTGEHVVPEAALLALTDQGIPFSACSAPIKEDDNNARSAHR